MGVCYKGQRWNESNGACVSDKRKSSPETLRSGQRRGSLRWPVCLVAESERSPRVIELGVRLTRGGCASQGRTGRGTLGMIVGCGREMGKTALRKSRFALCFGPPSSKSPQENLQVPCNGSGLRASGAGLCYFWLFTVPERPSRAGGLWLEGTSV